MAEILPFHPGGEFSTSEVGTPRIPESQDPQGVLGNCRGRRAETLSGSHPDKIGTDPREEQQLAVGQTIPYEKPLSEYVWWTKDKAAQEEDLRDWFTPLFHFIRWLRDHPQLRGLEVREAMDEVTLALRAKTPKNQCVWEYHFETDARDAEAEFVDVWDRIRFRPGESILSAAWRLAQQKPLRINEAIARRRPTGYDLFVSLAYWLQSLMPLRPILLPLKELEKLMGVDHTTVSRYRRFAKEDGYISEVKPAMRPQGSKAGRATEFRFDLSRFGTPEQRDV